MGTDDLDRPVQVAFFLRQQPDEEEDEEERNGDGKKRDEGDEVYSLRLVA